MSEEWQGEAAGREFERVADELRSRLADGRYPLFTFLPTQRDLAEEFRVQPSEPRASRWRGGVTLGPVISEAFEKPEVTLDVYTLTSESLDAHIRLQVERMRAGVIRPERIALRMLLPDESRSLPYPRVKGDRQDTRLQERLGLITQRHTQSLSGLLSDLQTEKLVRSVDVEIRQVPLTPAFKFYLLNGAEVLHGMYEVIERPLVLDGAEEPVTALDVLGLGATLTHHVKDDDPNSPGSVFVGSMQSWFDSCWTLLSE